MSKNIRFYFIFILGFFSYYFFDLFCFKNIQSFTKALFHSKAIAHVIAYLITLVPLIVTVKILLPQKNISDLFSINQSALKGFIFAFTGTLPMLLGYTGHFNISNKLDFESLFINTASSAFFEEVIFRAFLIGILFRFTRLGFLSSILLGSLLFAQAHLYQSQNTVELIEIFTITFVGSALFAWVYIEFNRNLWSAIFIHFFMNLYWEIFSISENVSGNLYGNLYKFFSVILIIVLLIYHKKNLPFLITWKNLFIKTREAHS